MSITILLIISFIVGAVIGFYISVRNQKLIVSSPIAEQAAAVIKEVVESEVPVVVNAVKDQVEKPKQ